MAIAPEPSRPAPGSPTLHNPGRASNSQMLVKCERLAGSVGVSTAPPGHISQPLPPERNGGWTIRSGRVRWVTAQPIAHRSTRSASSQRRPARSGHVRITADIACCMGVCAVAVWYETLVRVPGADTGGFAVLRRTGSSGMAMRPHGSAVALRASGTACPVLGCLGRGAPEIRDGWPELTDLGP